MQRVEGYRFPVPDAEDVMRWQQDPRNTVSDLSATKSLNPVLIELCCTYHDSPMVLHAVAILNDCTGEMCADVQAHGRKDEPGKSYRETGVNDTSVSAKVHTYLISHQNALSPSRQGDKVAVFELHDDIWQVEETQFLQLQTKDPEPRVDNLLETCVERSDRN